ncbi:MAG: PTS sugar transporter subunit IIB [Tractidigestivibacter sp.]|jgi:PTS system cellobiose-specific IIB component|uniref:PTS sugar transporter subunit IIB n=1 Tax=Tractidigestivibacter sp. TaxID=2847320 RepID=UPI003D89CBAF
MAEEKELRILLACGIGASTGFMAQNMRKVAKEQGLNCTIKAVSKSEVLDYADKIDVLLLGPHFSGEVPSFRKELEPYGVKVMAIDPDYYSSLDGEGILEDAYALYNGELDDDED